MARDKKPPLPPKKPDPKDPVRRDRRQGPPKDPQPLKPGGADEGKDDGSAPPPDPTPYEIGYRKPPKHTRFRPGQGGRGRQKGQKGLKRIVEEALRQTVRVKTQAGTQCITKLEALVHGTLNRGLKGDPRATDTVIRLVREAGLHEEADQIARSMQSLEEEDMAILDRYLGGQKKDGSDDDGE